MAEWNQSTPSVPVGSPLFAPAAPRGKTFDPTRDGPRLARQHRLVLSVMSDGQWHTLREIADMSGCPEASVSARLRDLRRPGYGLHTVERRRVAGGDGLHEYRVER